MSHTSLAQLSIAEAHAKLVAKEITVADLVHACLDEINAHNEALNVYLEVYPDLEAQIARKLSRSSIRELQRHSLVFR
jgi:Asp-tRNA(Asn)/Glu-tRNA(Gln) amidotransferase A subunit family amidase